MREDWLKWMVEFAPDIVANSCDQPFAILESWQCAPLKSRCIPNSTFYMY